MVKLTLGLIGYGHVGRAVVKLLDKRRNFIKNKFRTEFVLKTICDRSIDAKEPQGLPKVHLTKNIDEVLNDNDINVVIELVGGLNPAEKIFMTALQNGKHVITANKELLAHKGKELFKAANQHNKNICFESSVGAGIPIIKTVTEGVAGNKFNGIYGIINGTCNYILTEMTKRNLSFSDALKAAQEKGYAESNPTLDINGMDSAHKLAVLVHLAFGTGIQLQDIYVEGITHISHHDIEHAESLNLTIKLLAIAKRFQDDIEARVHPTLVPKTHPLAPVNGIMNAIFLKTDPLGDVLLYGEGAGPMAAASGVVSDLINLAAKADNDVSSVLGNPVGGTGLNVRKIGEIKTEFYLRFMATDKPGVLSKITGILGDHGVSISSVTQKGHDRTSVVPVIMLTHATEEQNLRLALDEIHKLPVVKSKPVAIRIEEL